MGLLKIENREERLPRRAMTPMRHFVILTPRGIPRRRRVVIGLGIVRGKVARRAEILGEKFHSRGQRLFAAHVLRAHAAGVASRDNAGARWRADCGRRVTPLEQNSTLRQSVDMGRFGEGVAIRTDGGRDVVLGDEPENVGPVGGGDSRRCVGQSE